MDIKTDINFGVANLISLSYYNNIKFEYDKLKSITNQQKHGIDFEVAKALWLSPCAVIEASSLVETRFLAIGKIADKFYSCVHTVREKDVIRLISVRRSRKSEERIYHECFKTEKDHSGRIR